MWMARQGIFIGRYELSVVKNFKGLYLGGQDGQSV